MKQFSQNGWFKLYNDGCMQGFCSAYQPIKPYCNCPNWVGIEDIIEYFKINMKEYNKI